MKPGDIVRVDNPKGGYRVWRVNSVKLGVTNQESVIGLTPLDQDENDEHVFVPVDLINKMLRLMEEKSQLLPKKHEWVNAAVHTPVQGHKVLGYEVCSNHARVIVCWYCEKQWFTETGSGLIGHCVCKGLITKWMEIPKLPEQV